jgi:NAD(P)-dependent dehydrogenase (short-subunit alcohol dehydrogenase family)|tara:strand:- start:131 stop:865 length:735 start_codon:yes stop_codon:yes gene_type:complete
MTVSETVLIMGVGVAAGVGAAVARKFAGAGYHVIIAGRTLEKLDATAGAIIAAGGSIEAVVADVTVQDDQHRVFEIVRERNLPVAAVIYNAGSNLPIKFSDLSPEQFEDFWRIGCFGAFLTSRLAIPLLSEQGSGSLFFTGASASLRGRPNFAHFAVAKAGLRNLAQALAREYGPQGVHVAHVIIDGVVNGDIVRGRFADYLESLGDDGALDPDAIAEAFWALHSQPASAWTHELDLRPYKESW